ncbi:MAG TPA: glycosyltransferase family 4 protein [Pyrinomonadaceae bacterium]|nr:glycosyltransferase family 4 protein [Pyrinomonadaceae bacterium]
MSELYYPEETSTGYYLTRIAEGLTNDFDVKVICGQPNYSARGVIAPSHEFHMDVEIFRARGTRLNKNVIAFRLINMATLGVSVFIKALRNFGKGGRALVVTTPPSMPFIVAVASLIRGVGYTLVIHDNYPEILIAVGKAKPGSTLVRTIEYLNRWLYKYAAKIIVVGRDMRELVERKTAGLDIPIETIPNWAEQSVEPRPRNENELLRSLGLIDKFVLLYAGNMGHPNDMESIISAAEGLKDHPEIHFVFLGTGVKRPWLERVVREQAIDNVTILDPLPRSDQITFLNACDVAIVTLVNKMWGVSMPSRTYNALAAGKPILGVVDPGSELARVVEDDNVGWIVPPNDPDALREVIIDIFNKGHELLEFSERARTAALERYSLDLALERYRAALI